MKRLSLFNVFLVAAVLLFGVSKSFAQDETPTERSAIVQTDHSCDVPVISDAVTLLALVPIDQAVSLTNPTRVLPVADGIVQYRARVQCAYWPRESKSKVNTTGFPWLHLERSDRVSRV